MRRIRLVLLALGLTVTGSAAAEGVPARHCEIFIDRMIAYDSSHGFKGVTLYVKTMNSRLDSAIAEVGFHHKAWGRSEKPDRVHDWNSRPLEQFEAAKDYWVVDLALASDFGQVSYEGVFYVRTHRGTTYWLNASGVEHGNFIIDEGTYRLVRHEMGAQVSSSRDPRWAVSTQRENLRFYNPGGC